MAAHSSTSTYTSSATVVSWDEDRSATQTPRLTPATVKMSLPDIKGSMTSYYAMAYLPTQSADETPGNARFTFSSIVEAEDLGGRAGSFIAQGTGSFDAGRHAVEGEFVVVPGSATAGLAEWVRKDRGGGGRFKCDEKDPSKVVYTFEFVQ